MTVDTPMLLVGRETGTPYIEWCRVCATGVPGGVERCWNCRGERDKVWGWPLSAFAEGEMVLQLPNLSPWVVEKHRRDGTTVLHSERSGRTQAWNSGANRLWIRPEFERDAVMLIRSIRR